MGLLIAAVVALLGGGLLAVTRPGRRDPVAQAALDRAVAAVDRELAANLELMTMFDQTRQAFVLENGQYGLHAAVLEREVPAAHVQAADVYGRIPSVESAMEKRGPANSLPDAERLLVEAWEGDARDLQRVLRAAAAAPAPSLAAQLIARLPVRRKGG